MKLYETPNSSVDWLELEESFLTATSEGYTFNPSGSPFHSRAFNGFEEDDDE